MAWLRNPKTGKIRAWIKWSTAGILTLLVLNIPFVIPGEGMRFYLVPLGYLRGFTSRNRGRLLSETPAGRALLAEFAGNYVGSYNCIRVTEDGAYEDASYSCFRIESLSTGRLGVESGVIYPHEVVADSSMGWGKTYGLRFVKWGDCHFLLTDDSIRAFAKECNAAEDYYVTSYSMRHRIEDQTKQPYGVPDLPPELGRLFKPCIDGRVVARGSGSFTLDKGAKDGLRPGMKVRVLVLRRTGNSHSADAMNRGIFPVLRSEDHLATCGPDKHAGSPDVELPHVGTWMTSRVPREEIE